MEVSSVIQSQVNRTTSDSGQKQYIINPKGNTFPDHTCGGVFFLCVCAPDS